MSRYNLEEPALELAEALSKAPPLVTLSPAEVRKAADAAQAEPLPMPRIDESWVTVPCSFGDVRVRLVRPHDAMGPLPVLV